MFRADWQIRQESKDSKLIDPFKEENLTPNGYDVTIENIDNFTTTDKWIIAPKDNFIVLTKEKINMPSNLKGELWIKTKWARKGIILSAGGIESGFKGKLNLCCFNGSMKDIYFNKGDKICQVQFAQCYPPEKLYEERSGNYQNQNRVIK